MFYLACTAWEQVAKLTISTGLFGMLKTYYSLLKAPGQRKGIGLLGEKKSQKLIHQCLNMYNQTGVLLLTSFVLSTKDTKMNKSKTISQ